MADRKRIPLIWIVVVVVVVIAIVLSSSPWKTDAGEHPDALHARSYLVRRGELKIGLVENGNLRASKHHHITHKLRHRRAKLAWVVEEGAQVKKGDKLLEFETKPIKDSLEQTERELEISRQKLLIAEEDLKIEESLGKSAVADALALYEGARTKLTRYREIEAPKTFRDLDANVEKARTKLREAEQKLTDLQHKNEERLFVEESQRAKLESQVSGAKKAVTSSRGGLSSSQRTLKMFKAHEYRNQLDAKQQAVENALLSLRKSKVSAKSRLLQKRAELKSVNDQIRRTEERIKRYRESIAKCIVESPAGGIVLYGSPNKRLEVKIGTEYSYYHTLLTIPDSSVYEVDIAVSEEYRGRLRPGCAAEVSIEAIPGLHLKGTLKRISSLARPMVRYDKSSPKVFDGMVSLANVDPRMVSGMTTRVELVAEVLEGVICLPIEALFHDDGDTICYVHDDGAVERRVVDYGKSSDSFVEITAGLDEGERVLLVRPDAGAEATTAADASTSASPVPAAPNGGAG